MVLRRNKRQATRLARCLVLRGDSMGGPERVGHGIEGRELVGLSNGGPQPSLRLVELELEEGAALALNCERLVERLPIEVLVELDRHCLRLSLQARHARSQTGVPGALLANASFIEGATWYLGDGLIKGVGALGLG